MEGTSVQDLTDGVQAFDLCEPSHVLFNPSEGQRWLREKFDNIPRYLFRVSTPTSQSTIDQSWAKSGAARSGEPNHELDVLSGRGDAVEAASEINQHLSWGYGDQTNFVSWTSSLLFALQYVFLRRVKEKDLNTIDVCVIDTAALPKGAFLRDIDLIDAYRDINNDLCRLRVLRGMSHPHFTGSYYFGEYLSQGALKIEGNCQIISAQAIIDQGLYDIQPAFKESAGDQRWQWANKVIRLREELYQSKADMCQRTERELKAAVNIAELFGLRWRLPVAANLIALRPYCKGDDAIMAAFKASPLTDHEMEECSPSKTKVAAYETLPEVQQYKDVMWTVYANFCRTRLRDWFTEMESLVDRGDSFVSRMRREEEEDFNRDSTLTDADRKAFLRRLNMIVRSTRSIREGLQV